MKRGKYIAEFLAQSKIRDEVGILLEDGGNWCLGIFLDRSEQSFRESEIAALEKNAFPVFAVLHALDIRTVGQASCAHRTRCLAAHRQSGN